jgi:hypothetical protein
VCEVDGQVTNFKYTNPHSPTCPSNKNFLIFARINTFIKDKPEVKAGDKPMRNRLCKQWATI